jgi:hypothetical protein
LVPPLVASGASTAAKHEDDKARKRKHEQDNDSGNST